MVFLGFQGFGKFEMVFHVLLVVFHNRVDESWHRRFKESSVFVFSDSEGPVHSEVLLQGAEVAGRHMFLDPGLDFFNCLCLIFL